MKKKQYTLLNIFDNSSTQNHTIPLRLIYLIFFIITGYICSSLPQKELTP